MKTCKLCSLERLDTSFRKRGRGRGRDTICKFCKRAQGITKHDQEHASRRNPDQWAMFMYGLTRIELGIQRDLLKEALEMLKR